MMLVPLAQAIDQLIELMGGDGIQPHRGFIEQQQARLAEQCLGQAEPLAHPLE